MGNHGQAILPQACSSTEAWARAIDEAERQISEAESKIAKLRVSIGTFRQMQESGEPFPAEREAP